MRLVFQWIPLCAFVLAIAGICPNVAWGLEWNCTLSTFNPIIYYNPLSPQRTTLNATVRNGIDCMGTPAQQVLVCVHIKTENSQNQRLLARDNYRLSFSLDSDNKGTGFGSNGAGSAPYAKLITIGENGHGFADLPLYMSIPSGQWVAEGDYTALIPPIVSLTYSPNAVTAFTTYGGAEACTYDLSMGSVATTAYNFQAKVTSICDIAEPVASLNFGKTSTLSFNINAITVIKVRCTAATSYFITLDGGLSPDNSNFFRSSGNRRRMRMGSTNNYIDYDLHQNAARTLAWKEGSMVSKTMPAGATNGPWDGPWQNHTVYGRVPFRASSLTPPAAGVYSDRVVITINY